MTPTWLRHLRTGAWASLVLLISAATWWYVRWVVIIPAQAARAFVGAPFLIEPQRHFQHYVHLFPQVVITEDPVAAFLRDYPLEWASPFLDIPGPGIPVLIYFDVLKGPLERYHLQFGTYPEPAHFPPINDEEQPDFWPSMESAKCRYLRLDKDSFLLGWAGPDGRWTDSEEVLRVLDRPYGLRVIEDDWWVKCRYFDFATYRRNYPKLAKEIILEPDFVQISWELIERVLQTRGIDLDAEPTDDQPLRGSRIDFHLDWGALLRQPLSLLWLGGIVLCSGFLVMTRRRGHSRDISETRRPVK